MSDGEKNNPSKEVIEEEKRERAEFEEKKPVHVGKILIDRRTCIGAGSCIAVAPAVFELDEENRSVVANDHGAEDNMIFLAAKSCPAKAIFIFDEDGNQMYP